MCRPGRRDGADGTVSLVARFSDSFLAFPGGTKERNYLGVNELNRGRSRVSAAIQELEKNREIF